MPLFVQQQNSNYLGNFGQRATFKLSAGIFPHDQGVKVAPINLQNIL
jgi:hypothetical protein